MADQVDKRLEPHVCTHCSSHLMQPNEWTRVDEALWQVAMRCPECFATYEMALSQDQVNKFSYTIEEGFQQLLEAVDQLDQESFEIEARAFIQALQSGNLYPMDF
ncbi:MAG: hypothetical protein ACYC6T_08345 [Thermoleophilia bacterium]